MKQFNGDLKQIGRMIDVSAVRTDVTLSEIDQLVEVAKKYNCICTFAMPCFTKYLVDKLIDSPNTMVGGVVGFPSGADTSSIKVLTAKEMIATGCKELDMVINVGALKSGKFNIVKDDIKAVVDAAEGIPVKSILEVGYLTDDEIAKGSEIAVEAGVTFVKTGTGWAPKPTTVETIKLIKSVIGDSTQIKAAGGVRDLDTLLKMIDAGCSRFGIGIRSAITIFQEAYNPSTIVISDTIENLNPNDTY
ncbi:deoxyribose-phosphate aldolase [Alkalibaculum sp. M08DMB]|uniref:Deoxyribose-phosphate aldolase n=1 Tax=Alkalibaculum sporogenes TaxID=2655001 RepID=A0A6A7K679_9FIRM|nr:deoxyribose-phosphate aldolase [Alkalibaculum sporogenes]MPW24663.1 deoxyribose-phosphate aldolase [Alkalibaculum sporogenes]